jgi:hypothetical protein
VHVPYFAEEGFAVKSGWCPWAAGLSHTEFAEVAERTEKVFNALRAKHYVVFSVPSEALGELCIK